MAGYKFERLKILVVDANEHMRTILKEILQAFGVTAISKAAECTGAWEEFRTLQPDIVFLDWKMPDMSGIEFTRMVRNAPTSPNPFVPIIMVTGYARASHVLQARDAGVTEVLAKPISPKGVMAKLTMVIEYPRSFVRTSVYFGPCRRRRNNHEYEGVERRMPAASPRARNDKAFVAGEDAPL